MGWIWIRINLYEECWGLDPLPTYPCGYKFNTVHCLLQVITEIQEGDKADVHKAVKAANEAFRSTLSVSV
jgi:hypothetical protein